MDPGRLLRPRSKATSGVSAVEIVLLFMVLVALVAVVATILPMHRTGPGLRPAGAQMITLTLALVQYHQDMGSYPTAPFVAGEPSPGSYADNVLFEALTSPDAGGKGKGWGGARDDWAGLRARAYRVGSATCHQFVDPWGSPYYYIASPDYARGVRIYDEADAMPPGAPNLFGAILGADASDTGREQAWQRHFGGTPPSSAFYNPTDFQIHSKGPDRKTGWNPGLDPDDVNNYDGVLPRPQTFPRDKQPR